MITKKKSRKSFKNAIFGVFFAIVMMFTGLILPVAQFDSVYAVEEISTSEETTVDENKEETEEIEEKADDKSDEKSTSETSNDDSCQKSLGAIGWLVCPTTGKISEATDWLYEKLQGILTINPVVAEDGSPIYEIWKYCLGISNIVFVIFLLVVIYSQITGYGITNYGIKKALPKLIVTAILVNLSFLICSIAVDLSNILGGGIRGIFTAVQESVVSNGFTAGTRVSYADMFGSLAGGGALAVGAGLIAFETGAIWMLIPTVLGAIVAVAAGLITVAMRQAVVALLIMIAPLAIVAYILPNTEQWFTKWKQLFIKMLVFYPMFSLLFGASSLAGFAIIASAKDGFGILLGTAVQIFPLFFSWKLMQMSGTFLSTINGKLQGMAAKPLAKNREWADSHRQLSKQKHLASKNAYTPSLKLMQFMSDRKIGREIEMEDSKKTMRNRALSRYSNSFYKKDGSPTKKAMEEYAQQAQNMQYLADAKAHSTNMIMGLGQLPVQPKNKNLREKLAKLDGLNVEAADRLFDEERRAEVVDYHNAADRRKRYEDAMNAAMDAKYGYKMKDGKIELDANGKPIVRVDEKTGKPMMYEVAMRDENGNFVYDENGNIKMETVAYRRHFDDNIKSFEDGYKRYKQIQQHMGDNEMDLQYTAASASYAYNTQANVIESRYQKYFELLPPTIDVVSRLKELTLSDKPAEYIDAIMPGLDTLLKRGDTDLLTNQMAYMMNRNKIDLGSHASQVLASFNLANVKNNDPFLRRLGKFINIETNQYYTGKRPTPTVTMDEYITGVVKDENGDMVMVKDENGEMKPYKPKYDLVDLMNGTPLNDVERTFYGNMSDRLLLAYTNTEDGKTTVNYAEYEKRRRALDEATGAARVSAFGSYVSGSEQMVNFMHDTTGCRVDKETGKVIADWEDEKYLKKHGLLGHEKELKEYYRDKSRGLITGMTRQQISTFRSDGVKPYNKVFSDAYIDDNEMEGWDPEEKALRAKLMNKLQNSNSETEQEDIRKEMAAAMIAMTLDKNNLLESFYDKNNMGRLMNGMKSGPYKWIYGDKDRIERIRKRVEEINQSGSKNDGLDSSADKIQYSHYKDAVAYVNDLKVKWDKELGDIESIGKWIMNTFGKDSMIYAGFKEDCEDGFSGKELKDKLIERIMDKNNY